MLRGAAFGAVLSEERIVHHVRAGIEKGREKASGFTTGTKRAVEYRVDAQSRNSSC
jgi:hypothetical protein